MSRRRTAFAIALLVSACGGAQPDTRPATHEDFRAIQGFESRIDAERTVAAEATTECPRACEAGAETCQAAEGICRIAHDTADLDALERCRRAERACDAASSAVRPRCRCRGGP